MLVPAHILPEDALEWYFDNYIADPIEVLKETPSTVTEDSSEDEEEEEEEKKLPQQIKTEDEKASSSQKAPKSSYPRCPNVKNVWSSASVGCSLDLRSIALRARNVELHRRKLKIQLRYPRVTANLTSDGEIMCISAKSVEDAHRGSRRIARIVQRLGYAVHFSHFRIRNIMVSYRTFPVSLVRLHLVFGGKCSYEPELFNCLFYKYASKIAVCIFSTGSITITGSTKVSDMKYAFGSIYPALQYARIES